MATCRKCGRPLIVKNGKCVYCGDPIQGSCSNGLHKSESSWIGMVSKSLSSSEKDWNQHMLRKTIISIIISMVLGGAVLLLKIWPGCFVAITMFAQVIVLTVFSFFVINWGKSYDNEDVDIIRANLSHVLNLILLWGGFFFVCGIICMFVNWWATLIVSCVALCGVFYVIAGAIETIRD